MTDERISLSYEDAVALLPDGEYIHTFRQVGMMLLGADWLRADILELLSRHLPELSGKTATAMGHGIVTEDANGHIFIATK